MGRAFRILYRFVVGVSALLCIAAAALWVRGRGTGDFLYVGSGADTQWVLVSGNGRLAVSRCGHWPESPRTLHRTVRLDLADLRGPAYALNRLGGARTSTTEWRDFTLTHGTVCAVLRADGSVDWDLPGITLLRSIFTARLSPPMPYWVVDAPAWAVVAGLVAVPLLSLLARVLITGVKRLRRKPGMCRVCGYDLRASPDRCPECGAANANAKAPSRQGSPKPPSNGGAE